MLLQQPTAAEAASPATTGAGAVSSKTVLLRRLPSLLQWHPYRAILLLPIVYMSVAVSMQRLPHALRYSDLGTALQVAALIVLPLGLCVFLGVRLRKKRLAVVAGALMGLAFYATSLMTTEFRWDITNGWDEPIKPEQQWLYEQSRDEIFPAMVFGAVVAFYSAQFTQFKHGRCTAQDKGR